MENNNIIKNKLLGMSHGTAVHQLRKMIMFQMIQELGKDVCYRCGKIIENINDLSVEHKIPWQSAENPKEMFFNLDNIAFSHLHCNISSADLTNRFKAQMRKVPSGFSYCSKCKNILPEDEFWNSISRICGKQRYCKKCLREYRKNSVG